MRFIGRAAEVAELRKEVESLKQQLAAAHHALFQAISMLADNRREITLQSIDIAGIARDHE